MSSQTVGAFWEKLPGDESKDLSGIKDLLQQNYDGRRAMWSNKVICLFLMHLLRHQTSKDLLDSLRLEIYLPQRTLKVNLDQRNGRLKYVINQSGHLELIYLLIVCSYH